MERPLCTRCGIKKALSTRKVCYACNTGSRDRKADQRQRYHYRKAYADRIAKGMCEFCEQYVKVLHVDHINGNHHDDESANWQVLCAPCHIMKTRLKGEYKVRGV